MLPVCGHLKCDKDAHVRASSVLLSQPSIVQEYLLLDWACHLPKNI